MTNAGQKGRYTDASVLSPEDKDKAICLADHALCKSGSDEIPRSVLLRRAAAIGGCSENAVELHLAMFSEQRRRAFRVQVRNKRKKERK